MQKHPSKKHQSRNAQIYGTPSHTRQQLVVTVKLVSLLSPRDNVLFLTRRATGEEVGDIPAPRGDASRDGWI